MAALRITTPRGPRAELQRMAEKKAKLKHTIAEMSATWTEALNEPDWEFSPEQLNELHKYLNSHEDDDPLLADLPDAPGTEPDDDAATA